MPPELETPPEVKTQEAKNFFDDLDKGLGIIKEPENKDQPDPTKDKEKEKEKNNIISDDEKAKAESAKKAADEKAKKEKPNPDDSAKQLRKDRDEARESLKVFTEVFGEHKPGVIKPLLEYLVDGIDGPLTEEIINEKLDQIKNSDTEIQKLRGFVSEREAKITELDVRESPEFKEKFIQPYQEAADALFVEFAKFDGEGKPVAPQSSATFHQFLMKNAKELNPISLKQQIEIFKGEFKKETNGEEISMPSVQIMMDALRGFGGKQAKMAEAYSKWATIKKETEEKSKNDQEQQNQLQQTRNARERKSFMQKAMNDFERPDFIEESKLAEKFQDEHLFMEKIFKQEEIPPHDQLIQRGVKSRLYDEFLPDYKRLLALEEEWDKSDRNHIPGQGGKGGKGENGKDWLEA